MKKNNKKTISLKERVAVLVTRGDGLKTVKFFYGAYDLILECGGNLGDVLHVIETLNAGGVVSFGTLRVSLA